MVSPRPRLELDAFAPCLGLIGRLWTAVRVPSGDYARGIWMPAAGGGKAHRLSVSHDDPRRPQVEIRGGREVRRDATDTP